MAKYWMIKHKRDKGNERTRQSTMLLQKTMSEKRMFDEGLNTTRYHLDSVEETPLFTWIKATINLTEVLQPAPPYIKSLFENGLQFTNKKPRTR
ncbi:hypothetical protein V1264_005391 [Littorina saxatilis]|uniref:Uncharacterized protein n=2 Tax=Littorina saxatilis TaxID=31220 RepID=A0AAN9AZ68_9CAEN